MIHREAWYKEVSEGSTFKTSVGLAQDLRRLEEVYKRHRSPETFMEWFRAMRRAGQSFDRYRHYFWVEELWLLDEEEIRYIPESCRMISDREIGAFVKARDEWKKFEETGDPPAITRRQLERYIPVERLPTFTCTWDEKVFDMARDEGKLGAPVDDSVPTPQKWMDFRLDALVSQLYYQLYLRRGDPFDVVSSASVRDESGYGAPPLPVIVLYVRDRGYGDKKSSEEIYWWVEGASKELLEKIVEWGRQSP